VAGYSSFLSRPESGGILWARLKRRALANFCAANLGELNTPELGILTERLGAREQMLALLEIPTTSWLGQRNRLLLTLLYNTGARGKRRGLRPNRIRHVRHGRDAHAPAGSSQDASARRIRCSKLGRTISTSCGWTARLASGRQS
jgi:hypothetical protein